MLKKSKDKLYFYRDGERIIIKTAADLPNGLKGDVSDLRGDVSGLTGNIDDCDITSEERKAGIKITDLIGE